MQDVKTIVTIKSMEIEKCIHCTENVKYSFDEIVNHYIQKHGYKILHVGQYTEHDMNEKPFHGTVAVIGNIEIVPLEEEELDDPLINLVFKDN